VGSEKSTITCNLAAISASQGLRTLVIDLDQQGNSTSYLLGEGAAEDQPNVAGFFEHTLSSACATWHPMNSSWAPRTRAWT
jgi:chromosome partitioning protein